MSERSDRKLRQVAIASFNYRHEAEFAAGFLEEAGIPYRLQIDDPTLGLSVTDAATIWVAAMDERRARRVLDTDYAASAEDAESWADEGAWGTGDAVEPDEDGDEGARRERDVWASLEDRAESRPGGRNPDQDRPGRREPDPSRQPGPGRTARAPSRDRKVTGGRRDLSMRGRTSKPDLTLRQRVIALLGGVGVGSTFAFESVRDAPAAVVIGVAAVAALLVLVSLLGQAPGVLRGILSALSGDAP